MYILLFFCLLFTPLSSLSSSGIEGLPPDIVHTGGHGFNAPSQIEPFQATENRSSGKESHENAQEDGETFINNIEWFVQDILNGSEERVKRHSQFHDKKFINRCNSEGIRPLHAAAFCFLAFGEENFFDIFTYLFNNGADPSLTFEYQGRSFTLQEQIKMCIDENKSLTERGQRLLGILSTASDREEVVYALRRQVVHVSNDSSQLNHFSQSNDSLQSNYTLILAVKTDEGFIKANRFSFVVNSWGKDSFNPSSLIFPRLCTINGLNSEDLPLAKNVIESSLIYKFMDVGLCEKLHINGLQVSGNVVGMDVQLSDRLAGLVHILKSEFPHMEDDPHIVLGALNKSSEEDESKTDLDEMSVRKMPPFPEPYLLDGSNTIILYVIDKEQEKIVEQYKYTFVKEIRQYPQVQSSVLTFVPGPLYYQLVRMEALTGQEVVVSRVPKVIPAEETKTLIKEDQVSPSVANNMSIPSTEKALSNNSRRFPRLLFGLGLVGLSAGIVTMLTRKSGNAQNDFVAVE